MKKIILSFLVMTFCSSLFAQVCVPTTPTSTAKGYIIPDSATNFASGCVGQSYEQIVYLKAPPDTTVTYLSIPITAIVDSFVVDANVTGLPAGLTVTSVPALLSGPSRLVIPGNTKACLKISGTIDLATPVGINNLSIPVRAYFSGIPIVGTLDTAINVTYYHINVQAAPCSPIGVANIYQSDFNIIAFIPNPAGNISTLQFENNQSKDFVLKITNSIGEVILTREIHANAGINSIPLDVSMFANGIYMYSLSDGKNMISQKLQIAK